LLFVVTLCKVPNKDVSVGAIVCTLLTIVLTNVDDEVAVVIEPVKAVELAVVGTTITYSIFKPTYVCNRLNKSIKERRCITSETDNILIFSIGTFPGSICVNVNLNASAAVSPN